MQFCRQVFLAFALLLSLPWPIQAGEIARGVTVSPVAFDVSINEAPFFGFVKKNEAQKQADAKFIAAVNRQPGISRKQAVDRLLGEGWAGVGRGDWVFAGRRFNQAWLLDPERSDIAHGFAIIVFERFKHAEYSLALFIAAMRLSDPLPTLPADHARVLMKLGRPAEAIPLLQLAIQLAPESAIPYSNLAVAYVQAGQSSLACETRLKVPRNTNLIVEANMNLVRELAKCR